MPTFKAGEYEFDVSIDGLAMREVRRAGTLLQGGKEVPIDLGNTAHLVNLADDVPALIDVLTVLCKESIKRLGLKSETFAKLIQGDAIEEGARAVVEAALDFFHGSMKSEIATCWEGRKEERKYAEELLRKQPQLTAAIQEKLNLSFDEMLFKLIASDSAPSQESQSASSSQESDQKKAATDLLESLASHQEV